MFEFITQADSTQVAVATEAGVLVTAKVLAGFSVVTKFATDLFLKIKGLNEKLPTAVKPFVALGVSMGLAFVNSHLTKLGGPFIADATVIPALLGWAGGMGLHSLINAIKPKAK